jgi:mevalonate kinase
LGSLPDSHPLSVLIIGTFKAVGITYKLPLIIHIHSTIPVASGLGSGAAVSVAIARALSAHLGLPLTDDQVSQLAYGTEAIYHGTPSGIDNTVVTYDCPVYFVKGQMIETLRVGAPFNIVIGDTGIPAPTKESVGDLRRLWERDLDYWEKIFDQVGDLAQRARGAIETGDSSLLGELMNLNHELLRTMTVSSPDLDRLVHVARSTGALGAKLSGGGRGGNMIALVKPDRAEIIANALRTVGAKNTIITTVQ